MHDKKKWQFSISGTLITIDDIRYISQSTFAKFVSIERKCSFLLRPSPQKSIFVQESPNELKFGEYVDTSPE